MKKLLVCLAILWAVPAWAETTRLDTIIVTPNRYDVEEKNLTSNVTVVYPDDVEHKGAKTVAELLRGVNGIYVYDNSSLKNQTVDIRGGGEYTNRTVLVLVDGRKVNPVDQSGPDWMQIPPEDVERIEIIHGSASVLYGDNATAGVINIITKKGQSGNHVTLEKTYGSYDTNVESLQAGGAHKNIDYHINWRELKTDGYRINSHIHSQDFDGRFGYKLIDQLSFDLEGGWHQDAYGLPGPLTAAQMAQRGRQVSVQPENFGDTKDRFVQLTTTADPWQGADVGKFIVSSSYRNRDTYAAFYSFGSNTKYNIDEYGITGKYVLERLLGGRQLNVVAGVDYYLNSNDILTDGGFTANTTIKKNDLGFYGKAEYEVLDNLFVSGGSRYQKTHYSFDQKVAPASLTKMNPDEQVNMGGIRYQYAPDSNVFADVQQTFRLLATDEWFSSFSGTIDTSLKQQKGIQYQAGIKHNFNNRLNINATPFYIVNNDEIFDDPTSLSGNGNYDKTRRVGIEAGESLHIKEFLHADFLDQLDFNVSYTYQRAKIIEGNFTGSSVPWVPWHQWQGGILIGFLNHYHVDFNGQWIGSEYAIGDQSNNYPRIKPHTVFDTRLSYTHGPLEVFAAINNIFAERYYSYVTNFGFGESFYPAPERNYTVGMKVKF